MKDFKLVYKQKDKNFWLCKISKFTIIIEKEKKDYTVSVIGNNKIREKIFKSFESCDIFATTTLKRIKTGVSL